MGLDDDLGIAFAKAQAAAKPGLPSSGTPALVRFGMLRSGHHFTQRFRHGGHGQ